MDVELSDVKYEAKWTARKKPLKTQGYTSRTESRFTSSRQQQST